MDTHRTLQDSRILLVDDQEANLLLLRRTLGSAGYQQLEWTLDPRQALPLFASFQPDLVLLDLHMPYLNGFEVMGKLADLASEETYVPVLVLTADATTETKQRALSVGARDFLTKPFDYTEVLLRVRNLLETRALHVRLTNQKQSLQDEVLRTIRDLEDARIDTVERLARAAEFRDDVTGRHTQRVGELSASLARAMGLGDDFVRLTRLAAPLHDVGKVGIRDAVLLKPGKLTPEEFEEMKTHTTIGAQILADSRPPLLQLAGEIALTHHERWDGSGYGSGLSGEQIPLSGRIVAAADVFDALTHERPYKKAWSSEDARAEIQQQSGRQFDPRVVTAFLAMTASDPARRCLAARP